MKSQTTRSGWSRIALLALLLVLLVAALADRAWESRSAAAPVTDRSTATYEAFMTATHRVDAVSDPLQFCLQFPDPPGSHWSADTTAAYCRMRFRPMLSLSDIDTQLQQGHATAVDRYFQDAMDTQLHDLSQPGALDATFETAGFFKANDDARKVIDRWKQLSPDSAFALAASGMQYVAAAQAARDDNPAQDLRQLLALARTDLDRAVIVAPGMTPAYAAMLRLGALAGDERYTYQVTRNALGIGPDNYAIRVEIANLAQPRFGRLFGGERAVQREAEQRSQRNPLLLMAAQLPAVHRVTCECGDSPAEQVGWTVQASDRNLSAGDLALLANRVHDLAPRLAIELYSEALRFDPGDADSIRSRAALMAKLESGSLPAPTGSPEEAKKP